MRKIKKTLSQLLVATMMISTIAVGAPAAVSAAQKETVNNQVYNNVYVQAGTTLSVADNKLVITFTDTIATVDTSATLNTATGIRLERVTVGAANPYTLEAGAITGITISGKTMTVALDGSKIAYAQDYKIVFPITGMTFAATSAIVLTEETVLPFKTQARLAVASTTPVSGSSGALISSDITITFNNDIKVTTTNPIVLTGSNSFNYTYRVSGKNLIITPTLNYTFGTPYTVVVRSSDVTDVNGYKMASDYTFNYTTIANKGGASGGGFSGGGATTGTSLNQIHDAFTDIADSWANREINDSFDAGFVNGRSDGTFAPNDTMTRAEFVKVLSLAMRIKTPVLDGNHFSDMNGHWANKYVTAMHSAGLITGRTDSTFDPDATITRQEAAVMVAKARALPLVGSIKKFSDEADIASWAIDYVYACVATKTITGYPDGTFLPKNNITRAEGTVLAYKAFY